MTYKVSPFVSKIIFKNYSKSKMAFSIQFIHATEETTKELKAFLEEWENENDFIEVQTSGSTGKPTKVLLEKTKMLISAKNTLNYLNIQKNRNALLCLSPTTIAGKMMVIRSIVGELNLIVGSVNSNPLENIDLPIEFIALVPMQLKITLEKCAHKLKKIPSILIGGGPISPSLSAALKENKTTVFHTYGMTETISHVAMRKVGENEEKEFEALPGITFSAENEQLVVNYPAINIDFLKTNDQIVLTSKTTFQWIGRTDFVINSGGKKLNPEEIEDSISELLEIPYFIGSLSDEKFGQKVILLIESTHSLNITKEVLRTKLSNYSLPKEIYYLEQFTRTASGKINRGLTMQQIGSYVVKEIL
jgi:O-succinylbenzoic acid--CoA ligase